MFPNDDEPFGATGKGHGRHGGRMGSGPGGGGPPGFGDPPGHPPGRPPFFPFGFLAFPFGRDVFARRSRARRGDVRSAILTLLGEAPRNGYQLMQELEQRSRGSWRPSPGSVYPALQQLEDEGLVCADASGGGKTFRLTDAGQTYLREHADEMSSPYPWEQVSDDDEHDRRHQLFATIGQLGAALKQVIHTGTPEQIGLAQGVLDRARRDLYRVLAGDKARGAEDDRK